MTRGGVWRVASASRGYLLAKPANILNIVCSAQELPEYRLDGSLLLVYSPVVATVYLAVDRVGSPAKGTANC